MLKSMWISKWNVTPDRTLHPRQQWCIGDICTVLPDPLSGWCHEDQPYEWRLSSLKTCRLCWCCVCTQYCHMRQEMMPTCNSNTHEVQCVHSHTVKYVQFMVCAWYVIIFRIKVNLNLQWMWINWMQLSSYSIYLSCPLHWYISSNGWIDL